MPDHIMVRERTLAALASVAPPCAPAEPTTLAPDNRALLGKAEIVLWRTAPETFRIEIWRSFAAYVWRFRDEARGEFR